MTVAALTPEKSYDEDGVTLTPFTVPFQYGAAANLIVTRRLVSGAIVTLAQTTDWTAADGPTDSGGALSLVSSVAGATLTIGRSMPLGQASDYQTNDRFPAKTLEGGLDRLSMVDQDQQREIDRAVKVPAGEDLPPPFGAIAEGQVVALVGGKLVGIDDDPAGAEQARAEAEAARDLAAGYALDTADDRAHTAADRVQTALDRTHTASDVIATGANASTAQTAAAAALAAGRLYADTATGIAATTTGQYFFVFNGPNTIDLHKNVAGADGPPQNYSLPSYAYLSGLLASLNLMLGSYPDTAFAWQSSIGQLAMRISAAAGDVSISRLLDMNGVDIFASLFGAQNSISAIQQALALLPTTQRQRLKKAGYYGMARPVMASDPITVAAATTATSMSSPVAIVKDDVRIRFLGGRWVPGTGSFPNTSFLYCMPVLDGDPTNIQSSTGLPAGGKCNGEFLEFILPAGQTVFEMILRNQGTTSPFFVDIDGVGTNANGYVPTLPGGFCYHKITLPASIAARTIRLTIANRPFGGLNVETAGTIAAQGAPRVISSIAGMGDSITEGSVSTTILNNWFALACKLLGIDNYINLGMGGTGYIARYPTTTATVTTHNGTPNVDVISGALVTGDYISGPGIPRDATIVTGATAGNTAVISANATLDQPSVTVHDETGRNFLDRINDILTAVQPATGSQASITTTNASASVAVVSGTLPAGAFVRGPNLQKATQVLIGATAGGTATLAKTATGAATSTVNIGSPPDGCIIAGGLNDRGVANEGFFSAADFSTQVLTLFQQLRLYAPDMEIFATGPFTDFNNPSYSVTLFDTAARIQTAAAQVPRVHFIDVSMLVTPANKNTVFNGTANGPHPVDAGHAIYGLSIFAAIAAIIGTY